MTTGLTLNEQDRRLIRGAQRIARLAVILTAIGAFAVGFGVYLVIWHHSTFYHLDHLWANGMNSELLRTLLAISSKSQKTAAQGLLQQTYESYLPGLFLMLGFCMLGLGTSLLLQIRATRQWLRIIDKIQPR